MSDKEKAPYHALAEEDRVKAGLPRIAVYWGKGRSKRKTPSSALADEEHHKSSATSRSHRFMISDSIQKNMPLVVRETSSGIAIGHLEPDGVYLVRFSWNPKGFAQRKERPGLILPSVSQTGSGKISHLLLYQDETGQTKATDFRGESMSIIKLLKADSSDLRFTTSHVKVQQCLRLQERTNDVGEAWWIKALQVLGFYTKEVANIKVMQMKGLKYGTQSGNVFLYKPSSNF